MLFNVVMCGVVLEVAGVREVSYLLSLIRQLILQSMEMDGGISAPQDGHESVLQM